MQKRQRIKSALVLGLLLALVVGSGPAFLKAAPAYHPAADASDDDAPYNALVIGVPWEDLGKVPAEDAGAVNVLYGDAGGLSSIGEQFWSQNSSGVNGMAEDFDVFGSALVGGDFNGDGYVDLAVGAPGEAVGDTSAAGIVHVLYSSHGRLSAANDERWHQGSPDIAGQLEIGDGFGSALAAADFNNDGYDDLAVGVPREDKEEEDSGAVNVIYGSAEGLTKTGNQIWDQDGFAFGTTEPGDMFGWALAVGYFDADAYADLAVGAPFEDWGETEDTGAVHVLYGSSDGLSDAGGQLWSQNDAADTREAEDEFGRALAAGDFDDNGYDDLAIGAPGETVNDHTSAGAVNVLYGLSTGLDSTGAEFWYQDGTYVRDGAESGDHFGHALAAGDFDGNGHADLAVGVPDEHIELIGDAGAVNVLYGEWSGLTSEPPTFLYQDIMHETSEEDDGFGRSLAAGDLNGDGRDDLAIGVPYEDVGDAADAGAVHAIYGGGGGLALNPQFWHQNSPGISGAAEGSDVFGMALVAIPTVKYEIFLPLILR